MLYDFVHSLLYSISCITPRTGIFYIAVCITYSWAAEILKSVLIKTEVICGEKLYVKQTSSAQCCKR